MVTINEQTKHHPLKRAFYYSDTNSKSCSKCGEIKGISLFFKHSQTSDGYHSWCKPCCKDGNNKSRQKKYSTFNGRIPTFLLSCRKNALKRQNEFSITREDLIEMWEKQSGLCCYTGIEMTTRPLFFNSVSVERVNNSIGYTKENTILVCRVINSMKSSMSGKEFFYFCNSVVNWLGNKNGKLKVDFKKYD